MRSIIAIVIAAELFAAPGAKAQSQATFVPALSVSTMHDDNVLSAPSGAGDVLTYIRPSLEGRYDSPTLNMESLISFDIQRSGQHSSLNTLDARRHAMFDGRVRSTSSLLLGLAARYDRTQTPGELNLDSGIMLVRQRAQRVQFTPSVDYRVTPKTTISTQYDWTTEALSSAPSGNQDLHVARLGFARQWSPRTTWSARYLGRLFVDDAGTHRSHAAMVGWTRRMTPATSLSLQAGPRVRSYAAVTSEMSAALIRRTPRTRFLTDYWHGETIVLGIPGPVAIHSGSAKMSWALRRSLDLGTTLGVFSSTTLDARQARVYHASLTGAWSREPYIVSFSYGSDLQQGDIRTRRSGDEQTRRGVFLIRLTVAPRLSRAFRPPDDADEATTPLKGVIQ
jgi:hypothetical protein